MMSRGFSRMTRRFARRRWEHHATRQGVSTSATFSCLTKIGRGVRGRPREAGVQHFCMGVGLPSASRSTRVAAGAGRERAVLQRWHAHEARVAIRLVAGAALARAVIREPRILVLDDALSSVDTHTEERILESLREIMKARTTIVIAHRLSTVRDADRIILLNDGHITESGTHDELVAQDGQYADMYRRQNLTQELGEL